MAKKETVEDPETPEIPEVPEITEPPKPVEPDELTKTKGELENIKRALGEERSKRQEAQRFLEYHQFQERYHAREGLKPPEKKEEDPDVAALKPLIRPILDEAMGPVTQENRMIKAELSEERARAKYKDYDQTIYQTVKGPDGLDRPFLEVLLSDQNMSQIFYNSPNPAEFAYRMALFLNWDKYLDKAKEEGRQEVIKKLEKGREAPTSLSKEAGARPIGEGELTAEQAAKLSPEAWAQLPEKTRRRLLGL